MSQACKSGRGCLYGPGACETGCLFRAVQAQAGESSAVRSRPFKILFMVNQRTTLSVFEGMVIGTSPDEPPFVIVEDRRVDILLNDQHG